MKKLFVLTLVLLITACGNTPTPTETPTEVPTEAPIIQADRRTEISPVTELVSDGLTLISSVDCSLISDETFETVSLYTSATKENGRFVWDDHARWVLEITSDTGNIFTLYDTEVTNGNIYFDIVEVNSKKFILIRNISTAADYTKAFTFEDGKLYETDEPDMNEMKNEDVNLIFTSVPRYR